MGIITFESFALFCIFVALGAYLVWQQVKAAGRNIEATLDRQPEDVVSGQAQEDEAQRRRMVHEADSKPEISVVGDSYTRSREAVARAQEAARKAKDNGAAEDNNKIIITGNTMTPIDNHGIYVAGTPTLQGAGGSFDGGGASGDWGGSSSINSSSSDCSSSSSDSGGSCGGSSD